MILVNVFLSREVDPDGPKQDLATGSCTADDAGATGAGKLYGYYANASTHQHYDNDTNFATYTNAYHYPNTQTH